MNFPNIIDTERSFLFLEQRGVARYWKPD